jgi:hypothetical protein
VQHVDIVRVNADLEQRFDGVFRILICDCASQAIDGVGKKAALPDGLSIMARHQCRLYAVASEHVLRESDKRRRPAWDRTEEDGSIYEREQLVYRSPFTQP